MSNLRRLRARQDAIGKRASQRIREATQPAEPTVDVVRGLVANAQSLRYIQLEVPRSRAPTGPRVTLLRRSGPLSAKGKAISWDGQRRVVTAYWAVEDLRAWLESIEAGDGSAGMQIKVKVIPTPEQIAASLASVWGCNLGDVTVDVSGGPALTPEQLAQMFHENYERLAPAHGYETREASAKPWSEVPENNRNLMVATCGALLGQLRSPNFTFSITTDIKGGAKAERAIDKVISESSE